MIIEVADIRVKEGMQTDFEKAVKEALDRVFPKAIGFKGHMFHKCIESNDRYLLQLVWETLEDHTVGFRGSPLFTEWRSLVGAFFASTPFVEHFTLQSSLVVPDLFDFKPRTIAMPAC
jgi:heme-degrading monooxygenase HmoA